MPNIEDFEWPYNGQDMREQTYDEGENLMRKIEELDDQLRKERERAEKAERGRDKWKEAHGQRIRHLKSESNEVDRLRRERDWYVDKIKDVREDYDDLREERDELYSAIYSLLLEAKCHAGVSKHLMQECEEAEQLINRLKGDK